MSICSTILNYNKYVKIIKKLLDYGADPNLASGLFLNTAAKKGFSKVITLLCRAGADAQYNSNAALKLAAVNDNPRCVLSLLFFGADFNALDPYQQEKFRDVKNTLDNHRANKHIPSGYVQGCCLFYWKSEQEKLCEQFYKLESTMAPESERVPGSEGYLKTNVVPK